MKDECLDMLMRSRAAARPEGTAFRDAVWREIRHRQAVAGASGAVETAPVSPGFFLSWAACGAALAVVMALATTAWHNRHPGRLHATTAIHSLHLAVFAADPGTLPHAMLKQRP